METMGLANRSNNTWFGTEKGSLNLKQRNGYSTMESPLATQLQQAWLQTQLPKRTVPTLDFLSSLPSVDYLNRSFSSSSSQPSPNQSVSPDAQSDACTSQSQSESFTNRVDSSDAVDASVGSDPMEDDGMIQYLSEMLMEEDIGDKLCMYAECSSYQAMTKELAALIGSPDSNDPTLSAAGGEEEKDLSVSSWIDEVLSASPGDVHFEPSSDHSLDYPTPSTPSEEVSSCATPPEDNKNNTNNKPTPEPVASSLISRFDGLELDCPYLEEETYPRGVDYSNGRNGIESLVELYPVLMQCAQAVATDDVRGANQLINQLRHMSSPFGDAGQRMTYYFKEALVARLSGTGAQLYTALTSNSASAMDMVKAFRLFVQCNPLPKISHYVANATIYNEIENADRIHIIDFGILLGVQWPCLLKKLSLRPGGPPFVRLTGIDFPQPGFHKNERVQETCRRLADKAKQMGIEFEYHAIAGKWENVQTSQLTLRADEVLIVNSMFRLRNLLDETVMASSPRKMVLAKIHSLNPKIFTMGVVSAGYNSPFFMARFREAFNHFSNLFDAVDSSIPPNTELRRLAEREVLGREILNIIACEGTERVERAEAYKQWHSRSVNAGFKQVPLDPAIVNKAQEIVKPYHRHYGIGQDGNWLLTGWRERVLHGITAWRPS